MYSATLNFNPKTKQFYIFTDLNIPESSMHVFTEAFTKTIILSTSKASIGVPCGLTTPKKDRSLFEINISALSAGLIGCGSGQTLNVDVTNGIISFTAYSGSRQLLPTYKNRTGRSEAVLKRYAREDTLERKEVENALNLYYVQASLEQCVQRKKDISELRREHTMLLRQKLERLKASKING